MWNCIGVGLTTRRHWSILVAYNQFGDGRTEKVTCRGCFAVSKDNQWVCVSVDKFDDNLCLWSKTHKPLTQNTWWLSPMAFCLRQNVSLSLIIYWPIRRLSLCYFTIYHISKFLFHYLFHLCFTLYLFVYVRLYIHIHTHFHLYISISISLGFSISWFGLIDWTCL